MLRRDGFRSWEEPLIRLYPDGPMLVRGVVPIVDEDGATLRLRRKVVAFCRCGRSRMTPLCDGSHQRRRQMAPA